MAVAAERSPNGPLPSLSTFPCSETQAFAVRPSGVLSQRRRKQNKFKRHSYWKTKPLPSRHVLGVPAARCRHKAGPGLPEDSHLSPYCHLEITAALFLRKPVWQSRHSGACVWGQGIRDNQATASNLSGAEEASRLWRELNYSRKNEANSPVSMSSNTILQ